MQQKNFLLFLVLSFLLLIGWMELRRQFAPQRPNNAVPEKPEEQPAPPPLSSKAKTLQLALGPIASLIKGVVPPAPKPVALPSPRPITAFDKLVGLGNLTAPRNSICTCTATPGGLGSAAWCPTSSSKPT